MSRIEGLVIALGLLLIVFGLALDEYGTSPDDAGSAGPPNAESYGAESQGAASTGSENAAGRAAAPQAAGARREAPQPMDAAPMTGAAKAPKIALRLTYASDGAPAAGVNVELWRRATGEGAAYRSARRLVSGRATGADGTLTLEGPAGNALDLFCRPSKEFAPIRIDIAPLQPGERRTVTQTLARPPGPLTIQLVDGETNAAVAGASIRAVTRRDLRLEDFPGTSELLARTDGSGQCELRGPSRLAPWLLIDAASYGPSAIRPSEVAAQRSVTLTLQRAAQIQITVVDGDGNPVPDCEVRALFAVNGFATTATTNTNRHGKATLRRLPPQTLLEPTVTPPGQAPKHYAPLTLKPGDTHDLRISITPR